MANIQQRAGRVLVRVGGNTQETATLVDSLPDGRALEKDLLGVSNPVSSLPISTMNWWMNFELPRHKPLHSCLRQKFYI